MSEREGIKEAYKRVEFTKLICNRIEALRPKLLDLTRRNPLISTKFSDRSNSLVRVVDEVPEVLLNSIQENEMRIVPLPDLGTDPKDEMSREFQSALAESRLNDEVYLKQLDDIDEQSDDAPDLLAKAERQLKDRLREQLGMPPRQTKNNLSLQQHAKNHGISPHYELFYNHQQHEDGRHTDQDIQTLLLPDVLERRLNALIAKERTWTEETGISVLHAAFGFLEWEDGNNSKPQYSPLVLIPVQIEKKRSREGQEFWVSSDDGEAQENKILAEKLRLESGITLPEYTGQELEEYFHEVSELSPKNITWRVRRWAAIGVFPSARLAMYHDLNTEGWDFASHNIVSNLFGGSETGHDAMPFGEEYEVDEPEIENRVPYLITDADSSQFSTIVDVIDGKNLAVEGPPGTGKSQTIVNTIAASLASGKKVLFVAEKSAALEVVRSRLEAFGLGEFLLPLLANRTGKELVISSVRERVEMRPSPNPAELDHALNQFKEARKKLKIYIDILSSNYGNTDISIHTVLGCGIKYSQLINSLPENMKTIILPDVRKLTSGRMQDLFSRCEQIEEAYAETKRNSDYWKAIKIPNIDPFRANEILDLARQVSEEFHMADTKRQNLCLYQFPSNLPVTDLKIIAEAINILPENLSRHDIEVAGKLQSRETIDFIKDYLKKTKSWREYHDQIIKHFTVDIDSILETDLDKIKNFVLKYEIQTLTDQELDSVARRKAQELDSVKKILKMYDQSLSISGVFKELRVSNFLGVLDIVGGISKQALAVRKPELDDPTIQTLFCRQIEKVNSLVEKRKELNKAFDLSLLPEPEILLGYSKTISNSGLFSFLSGPYRQAKRFYKSLLLSGKFKKKIATQRLRELYAWKSGVNSFCSNEMIKTILGPHLDGIDTQFSPFQEAIDYYQKVDQIFQGASNVDLRKFLKSGTSEDIKSLPLLEELNLPTNVLELTLTSIPEKADLMEKAYKDCESEINQLKALRSLLRDADKLSGENIIKLPELFSKLKRVREELRQEEVVQGILGDSFRGENTTEDDLDISLTIGECIVELDNQIRSTFLECARKNQLEELKECVEVILETDKKAMSVLDKIASITKSDSDDWIKNDTYGEFAKQMNLASKDKNGLIAYSRFVAAKNTLGEYGYGSLVESIYSQNRNDVRKIVGALIMREMARDVYRTYGDVLSLYNGSNLELLRKQLQAADRKVIELSRRRLRSELYHNANPPAGVGWGRKSEYTELALLKNEISKKQRHIPVRSLTKRAANALLEIKPCWMMSPLSVAQFLTKGEVEFDLVIIDEASQMTPEDSIGALIRAKQAMVVGDTNQLPPTGFFRKVLEDEEVEEDEKVTEESILEMANASFKPARRLRWHYRSRNSGLIAFSNKHVYNNNLVIFPSAQEDHPEMGVSYVKVNGKYSAGTNPEEAKVMVDAIIDFMGKHKNKSLGVVLLNQKQRDLLDDEMNYAKEQYPHAREYIETWEEKNDGLESFFIKNLENVQGDERDVILIGTVYGPEKEGVPVMQRFGPINGIAGKRRLNVLFSRAKERIVTFSSMTASDIRAEEDGNPGVYMLKCWLEYANSGVLERGQEILKEPDSEFEEHVIQQIKSIGCEAIPQVGVRGYSIDIGVKHPDWPHGFIMGVECDGASYHSSKSARDRDRLRQEVLEGLGWNLYRIWSTDWFEDPVRETEKLRVTIENRVAELIGRMNLE